MALGFQSEEGTASSWRRVGRPRCASAQGARDTPPHGRGPLSLLSRPTSCLRFFQCFVVMVKCTSCKFYHLNRMRVSVLSISM